MKRLNCLIASLFVMVIMVGQTPYKNYLAHKDKSEAAKIIAVYASSIILNGVGDGLYNSNLKTWGHVCNAVSIGILITSPFIIHYDKDKWWIYLLDYGFLRYGLFDASYNLSRGLPYNYIGTTAGTDIIFHKAPANFRTFSKGISMVMGISLPINQLGNNKRSRHAL